MDYDMIVNKVMSDLHQFNELDHSNNSRSNSLYGEIDIDEIVERFIPTLSSTTSKNSSYHHEEIKKSSRIQRILGDHQNNNTPQKALKINNKGLFDGGEVKNNSALDRKIENINQQMQDLKLFLEGHENKIAIVQSEVDFVKKEVSSKQLIVSKMEYEANREVQWKKNVENNLQDLQVLISGLKNENKVIQEKVEITLTKPLIEKEEIVNPNISINLLSKNELLVKNNDDKQIELQMILQSLSGVINKCGKPLLLQLDAWDDIETALSKIQSIDKLLKNQEIDMIRELKSKDEDLRLCHKENEKLKELSERNAHRIENLDAELTSAEEAEEKLQKLLIESNKKVEIQSNGIKEKENVINELNHKIIKMKNDHEEKLLIWKECEKKLINDSKNEFTKIKISEEESIQKLKEAKLELDNLQRVVELKSKRFSEEKDSKILSLEKSLETLIKKLSNSENNSISILKDADFIKIEFEKQKERISQLEDKLNLSTVKNEDYEVKINKSEIELQRISTEIESYLSKSSESVEMKKVLDFNLIEIDKLKLVINAFQNTKKEDEKAMDKIKGELKDSNTKLGNQSEEMKKKENIIASLELSEKNLRQDLNTIKIEMDKLDVESKDFKTKLENQKEEIRKKESTIKTLEESEKKVKSDLNIVNVEIDKISSELKDSKTKLEKQLEEMKKRESTIKTLEESEKNFKSDLGTHKIEMDKIKSELKDLNTKLENQAEEMNKKESTIASLELSETNLKSDVETNKMEMDKIKNELIGSNTKLESHTLEEMKKRENVIVSLELSDKNLKRDLNTNKIELDKIKGELKDSSTKLEYQLEEIKKKENIIASLELSENNLKQDLNTNKIELDKIKGELQDSNTKLENQFEEIKKKENIIASLELSESNLKQDLNTNKIELDKLDGESKDFKTKLENQVNEMKKKEYAIASLELSEKNLKQDLNTNKVEMDKIKGELNDSKTKLENQLEEMKKKENVIASLELSENNLKQDIENIQKKIGDYEKINSRNKNLEDQVETLKLQNQESEIKLDEAYKNLISLSEKLQSPNSNSESDFLKIQITALEYDLSEKTKELESLKKVFPSPAIMPLLSSIEKVDKKTLEIHDSPTPPLSPSELDKTGPNKVLNIALHLESTVFKPADGQKSPAWRDKKLKEAKK